MDTTAIQIADNTDHTESHRLLAHNEKFDRDKRKYFAQNLAEKLLGLQISDSGVNVVSDLQVNLANIACLAIGKGYRRKIAGRHNTES